MCGIAGFIDLRRQQTTALLTGAVMHMAGTLRHRGPDDQGCWVDAVAGIALGHRRLSVIDVSTTGHQPMVSRSGRYVIIFNGEIFNFLDLRRELECAGAAPFQGHSDTEVMLAAFDHWGVRESVERLNGMFAFALWDRTDRVLYLCRDRMGEKPLYYGWMGDVFLFGSELKALRAHPAFHGRIDRDALALYFYSNSIPAPYSVYREICKLPPASLLRLQLDNPRDVRVTPYWSLKDAVETGLQDPFSGTEADAIDHLELLLRDSVRMRMISDVPLGAFLSGGIDSALVVALMRQNAARVRTFTIGFETPDYDEAQHARAVARHLGTEHVEHYVSAREALGMVPRLASVYDEPFADSSQIPTLLVSQLARQYITVCLSGDGGDEIFGGYNRYIWTSQAWRRFGWLPRLLRWLIGAAILKLPVTRWDALLRRLRFIAPTLADEQAIGDKLHKLARVLGSATPVDFYMGVAAHWSEPQRVVPDAGTVSLFPPRSERPAFQDFEHEAMYLDTLTWLPTDMLTKVDRASMSCGLETRIPLLDHRVVEFAWSLPLAMKIRGGTGKWILRQVLHRHVPAELVAGPKRGFGVPLDSWLRGPLRDWAESLLDERTLREQGMVDPGPIRQKWAEHLSGRRNWQLHLWDVFMWQAWLADQQQTPQSLAAGGAS